MKRTQMGLFVVAVQLATVALLAGVLVGCGGQAQEPAPAPKPALTVTATTAQQTMLPVTLSANGSLAAWQEASVGAEAAGLRIAEVHVGVGDRVQRGQVLVTFASDTLRAELAQAQASLAEAEASAEEAVANAQRARSLQSTGAMSAAQIGQYLTAEKTAQARVLVARAALEAQQVRLSQSTVRAPDDGVISARNATVGAVVSGGTELFRLIRKGRLEWRAEVTSTELGRLKAGTPATVTAASGARLSGRVRMVGPTVDPQNRMALVYVDVQSGADATSARAGMFAQGEFELGKVPALTVPQTAVVVREGFNYVFRLTPEGRVSQIKVQIGRVAGDRMEVRSGLEAGVSIVESGGGFLNDGDLVRVAGNGAAKQ